MLVPLTYAYMYISVLKGCGYNECMRHFYENFILKMLRRISKLDEVACVRERKGKEEYLYSALIQCLVSRRSDMDHTVLPENYTMSAFPS